MGCKVSKLVDEDGGKLFMQEAVLASWDAFAASLSRYAITLKHAGAALSDYTDGVAPPPPSTADWPTSPPPPPPPPPLESPILPSSSPSLMPMGPLPRARFTSDSETEKPKETDEENIEGDEFDQSEVSSSDNVVEDEKVVMNPDQKDFDDDVNHDHGSRFEDDNNDSELEFKTEKHFWSHEVDMSKIMSNVDDQFLRASESVYKVSKLMNGANRTNNHSNSAENRGLKPIDYSAKIKKLITWTNVVPDEDDQDDEDEYETHASVLNELFVWEKKLYKDAKAFKPLQNEYNRKVSEMNRLKLENSKTNRKADTKSTESLEKAKADVYRLFPRYTVEKELLEATLLGMNEVRDKQLYPQLVSLIHGMTTMWESMLIHHSNQMDILKSLDIACSAHETDHNPLENSSKNHHDRTQKLLRAVEEWPSNLDRLVASQKDYICSLNKWLKQNLVLIKTTPPIKPLLEKWEDCLARLPHEVPRIAISSFASDLRVILGHQEVEMELKEKLEEARKEYEAFQEQNENGHVVLESNSRERKMEEDKMVLDELEKRMEDRREEHEKWCIEVRKESSGSLRFRLPELFRAMSGYAHASFHAYRSLTLLTVYLDKQEQ